MTANADSRSRAWILLAVLASPAATSAEAPDMTHLASCADRAWTEDVDGWGDYVFDRKVVLTDLGRNGGVKSRKERHFRMTPQDRGFDERLLSEDGRPPTAAEIHEFRRKANFTKTYRGASRLEFSNPLGENLVLMPVLRGQSFRYLGEREIDGIRCHLRVFEAHPEPARGSANQQLMHAIRGSTCVTVDGCHLVSLELETIRPIKQSLTRIDYLRVEIEGRPVPDGWVPAKIVAHFDFNVLGRKVRRVSSYSYSRFRRAR